MSKAKTSDQRRSLVEQTAGRLRDLVFTTAPGEQIGSLPELAKNFGVGIVTVQQAARVLEHEGLLNVRRGPGGGYYGARPDGMALERMLAAYLRARPASFGEALNITSLLFNELVAAAAGAAGAGDSAALQAMLAKIEACRTMDELGRLESDFQDILFGMVGWPLLELLTRVTLHVSEIQRGNTRLTEIVTFEEWQTGRRRIIGAILRGDPELARFEAERNNRRIIRARSVHVDAEWRQREP